MEEAASCTTFKSPSPIMSNPYIAVKLSSCVETISMAKQVKMADSPRSSMTGSPPTSPSARATFAPPPTLLRPDRPPLAAAPVPDNPVSEAGSLAPAVVASRVAGAAAPGAQPSGDLPLRDLPARPPLPLHQTEVRDAFCSLPVWLGYMASFSVATTREIQLRGHS